MINAVVFALMGLDRDGRHRHLIAVFDEDIKTDQLNACAWALVEEWAGLCARWLLACTNLRGNKPNSGDV